LRRPGLVSQLASTHSLILVLAVVLVTVASCFVWERPYTQQIATSLEQGTKLLARDAAELIPTKRFDILTVNCVDAAAGSPLRFSFILPSGEIGADSAQYAERDRALAWPGVREALSGRIARSGTDMEPSASEQMFVCAPVKSGDEVIGVVRGSVLTAAFREVTVAAYSQIAIIGLIALVLTITLSVLTHRRISRDVSVIRTAVRQLESGQAPKFPPIDSEEIVGLAETLGVTARTLNDRFVELSRQRNEREAILTSMVEGVIAVDLQNRIVLVNDAVGHLLSTSVTDPEGKPLEEAVRNADLHRFVAGAQSSRELAQGEIVVRDPNERIMLATATPLQDANGGRIGTLIMLNDVTQLRRLERVRKDFVANVTHELKTPISAIQGAVETLGDGGPLDIEDTKRFLDMILRHSNRLNAIIDDLLYLARVEEEEGRSTLDLEEAPLMPSLRGAVVNCTKMAMDAGIQLRLTGSDELRAAINGPLLEQAVTNLLENAIRYSGQGKEVAVEVERVDGGIEIHVRDQGIGIEAHHLPRLFERFYRADAARTRASGGTGLGLAIVKHIVQAHGGEIGVTSIPGKGSVFTIRLAA
jgi:two-component system phosphate regulon sensor histidine kinase PhoR